MSLDFHFLTLSTLEDVVPILRYIHVSEKMTKNNVILRIMGKHAIREKGEKIIIFDDCGLMITNYLHESCTFRSTPNF